MYFAVSGLNKDACTILLCLVSGAAALVSGVGGAIYFSYFVCVLVFALFLTYFADVYFDTFSRDGNVFGSVEAVYNATYCARGHQDNNDDSVLTFASQAGFLEAVALLICKF